MQPFLFKFQSNKPMVSFLANDLGGLIRSLMKRFIKDNVLTLATTDEKLVKIDITKTENHKSYKAIDIGFCAEQALKDAVKKGEKNPT